MAGKNSEVEELRRRLDEEVARRDRLVEVAGLLSSTLKLEQLLVMITEAAAELLEAETSSLLLLDDETGELIVDIAQALASFAAVAIDNASLYARLADAVVTARLSYRL